MGDAIRGVDDGSHLSRCGSGRLICGDEVFQRVADRIGADGEFCHCLPSFVGHCPEVFA